MQNILGISLKTKHLGIAIFYNGELSDYRVRTFYGVWTQQKRNEMHETIKKVIKRYGISVISLKTPIPALCSESIRDIINDLRQLTEQLGIKLTICTITALKKLYSGNGRGNKQTLIQAIVCRYSHHPKLAELYGREQKNRHAYHVKIFEAIACGELALRTLQ